MNAILEKLRQASQIILLSVLAGVMALVVAHDYLPQGMPYTHDGESHLARFANYKIALREGQFPPRWAPNLFNRYGYPVFNYNYPLANILSVPFSFVDVPYQLTFKLVVIGSLAFGIAGVFYWLKLLGLDKKSALAGVAAYVTLPYLHTIMLYRGNIGEHLALTLLPWALAAVTAMSKQNKFSWAGSWWQVLSLTALLLSHNLMAVLGLVTVIGYGAVLFSFSDLSKEGLKTVWKQLAVTVGWAVGLTLWFWLPALAEQGLVTVSQTELTQQTHLHVPALFQLLLEPIRFGFSHPGTVDGLSFSLGLVQVIAIVVAGVALWLKKVNQQDLGLTKVSLAAILISIVMMLWPAGYQRIPAARMLQFPWRLEFFIGLGSVLLLALHWSKISAHKWLRRLVVIVFIFQAISLFSAKPVDRFSKTNVDYDAFAQSTSTQNENLPLTFQYTDIADWQPTPSVATGSADFHIKNWTGSSRSYLVMTGEPTTIIEPTMRFAGWTTSITQPNGILQPATYIDSEKIAGRLAYQIPAGTYQVETQFTQQTWPRQLGNLISFTAIILWLLLFLHHRKFFTNKDRSVLFWVSWVVGLFVVGYYARQAIAYLPSFPYAYVRLVRSGLPEWVSAWANFDGVHYLTIIRRGYLGTALVQAFFPVYPILAKGVSLFVHPILAGVSLSLFFSFVLMKVWQKTLLVELGKDAVWTGTLILFLFPTALFFHAMYTEALFLCLVLGSLLAARQRKWWTAGILAAVASATRVVGILLIPALVTELLNQYDWNWKTTITDTKRLLPIAFSAVGLLAYMIYLQVEFSDPLYFFNVQAEFGGGRSESLVLYPQVVWRYLKIFATSPLDLKYFAYIQEFMAGTLGLLLILWSWFKVRKSYVVFSLLAFIVPTLTGTFSSISRYLLVSFSAFMILTMLLKDHQKLKYFWYFISTLLLIINTVLFIQGYWVA